MTCTRPALEIYSTNNLKAKLVRIRIGTLVIMLSCLGTAMAISGRNDDSSSAVVGAVEKAERSSSSGRQSSTEPAEVRLDLRSVKRRVPKNIPNNELFTSRSWYVPPVQPKPQISNLPPPPPSAPPMPFTYVGRFIDGGEVTLFLSKNGRQYTVKKNDVLDDTYRVDEIKATEATITHLPTNTPQTLTFNSAAVSSSSLSAAANSSPTTSISDTRKPLELVPLAN